MLNAGMPFIIALVIVLWSHLSIDRSFTPEMKTTTNVVFIIITIIYVIFGLFI